VVPNTQIQTTSLFSFTGENFCASSEISELPELDDFEDAVANEFVL